MMLMTSAREHPPAPALCLVPVQRDPEADSPAVGAGYP